MDGTHHPSIIITKQLREAAFWRHFTNRKQISKNDCQSKELDTDIVSAFLIRASTWISST